FRGRGPAPRHRVLEWLSERYGRLVARAVAHARNTVAAALAVVAGAVWLGAGLASEFLPQLAEGVICIRANLPPGISVENSAEVAATIGQRIRPAPVVTMVRSRPGRNGSGSHPFGPNRNDLRLELTPCDNWPHGRTTAALLDQLPPRLQAAIPGAAFKFARPLVDTSTE